MEATKKICVRCKQKDITEFSTCRFCGTRYDALLPQARPQSSFDLGSILRSRLGLFIVLTFCVLLRGPLMASFIYIASGGHSLSDLVKSEILSKRAANAAQIR